MGFVNRSLASLASLTNKFWQFDDGKTAPVNAAFDVDPDTGFASRFRPYPELSGWLPGPIEYASIQNGTSAVNRVDGSAVYNPNGSCRAYNITAVGSTSLASGAVQSVRIHGRTVGVRYRRTATGVPPIFDLVIDGVSYRCDDVSNFTAGSSAAQNSDTSYYGEFIVRDLDDRQHDVSLVVPDSRVTGTNYTLVVLDFLAEKASGYPELPRVGTTTTPAAVPTSAGDIGYATGFSANLLFRGVRKVVYLNTTGADITVTVQRDTAAVAAISVPANRSAEFDFGIPVAFDATTKFKHLASATGVNYTVIGTI